jgi:hypothetical protein
VVAVKMLDEWVVHGVEIQNARFLARGTLHLYITCIGGGDIYRGRLYLGWACFCMVDRVLDERSFFVSGSGLISTYVWNHFA